MSIDKLVEEIETFYKTIFSCKQYILGTFSKRQSKINIDNMGIPFSDELKYLYSNYDVDLWFNKTNIHLIKIEMLNKIQYGYKYISNDFGKTWEPNKDWNENWVVFADMNDGNPIVADVGINGTPIYAAIEAQDYMKIAPSLDIFFKILTELLKTCEINSKNEPDINDNIEEHIKFYEEIFLPYFIKRVGKILNEECINNFTKFII